MTAFPFEREVFPGKSLAFLRPRHQYDAHVRNPPARRCDLLMDFSYPIEAEAFRIEVRTWLEANLDERFRDLGIHMEAGPEWLEPMREWNHRAADAGYVAIGWPTEFGGRDASIIEQVVLAEEIHRARAPGTINLIGIANIAPSIIGFGTEEQKARFLPRMRRGDDIWCQGFSEPDAGSDLASLRTTAVRDGDYFVVTGQKVWNTLGHIANWCELLVRTDTTATKHAGISCLLVDMTLPGIDVRPLVTITGEREFCELFFNEVRVPVTALLGPEHQGWVVAMTTLANERARVADLHLQVRGKIADLLNAATKHRRDGGTRSTDDPVIRQLLADLYVRGEYLKLLADRALSDAIHGLPPGPGSSVVKLLWSELEQEVGSVAGSVFGADANRGRWGRERVYSRALTIAGGTTEINKNIIAQRVLGLPRH